MQRLDTVDNDFRVNRGVGIGRQGARQLPRAARRGTFLRRDAWIFHGRETRRAGQTSGFAATRGGGFVERRHRRANRDEGGGVYDHDLKRRPRKHHTERTDAHTLAAKTDDVCKFRY
jgi:hypothetical protein